MGADELVHLGTLEQLEHPQVRTNRPPVRVSDYERPPVKLPLRTRAVIIIGLAILAWLPIIALGYAITVRL